MLKLKIATFLHYKPFYNVKQNILIKPISALEISMSVTSNSIAHFLNFALKNLEIESLIQLLHAMKELNLWPCICTVYLLD